MKTTKAVVPAKLTATAIAPIATPAFADLSLEAGKHRFRAAQPQLKTSAPVEIGGLVAAFLAGVWRSSTPALDLPNGDLETIAPLLLQTGAGPLAWWRVRQSELQTSETAVELRQAYRLNALNHQIHQAKVDTIFAAVRAAGIEPILIKGWSAARYYPAPGLRPYGDLDICVRRKDFETANKIIDNLGGLKYQIDLHSGFTKFGIRAEEDLYARSQLIRDGETEVRILGPEDHLRVVCFHLMREGAWRALWLVDVAAALESRAADFNWDYCLGERLQARPVISAIGLAHSLLGAEIEDLPGAERFKKNPRWLAPTVLKEWGSKTPSMPSRHAVPMLRHVRRQGDILQGLRHRWPNPIEATTTMNGAFNDLPRLPYQIGHSVRRVGAFLTHLPKNWNK